MKDVSSLKKKTRIHNFFCVKRNVCCKKDIFSLKETTFAKQNKKATKQRTTLFLIYIFIHIYIFFHCHYVIKIKKIIKRCSTLSNFACLPYRFAFSWNTSNHKTFFLSVLNVREQTGNLVSFWKTNNRVLSCKIQVASKSGVKGQIKMK